ncbi:DSD1 family PLP-dependent enzyme [Kistimonas scapharcae]|uniref:DSD1 family PLP-dependent enzyme n=1 Tax=Kistimonas scapharcae TaxID=1036133 RepID=A0ABP8UZB3_9GAMM
MLWLFVAVVVLVVIVWPRSQAKPYDHYFSALNQLVRQQMPGCPVLIVDLNRVDQNLERVKAHLGDPSQVRIAAKSLPSPELIRYLLEKLGSNRLMSFHLPFLLQQFRSFPGSDFLVGKPFPVTAVKTFLRNLSDEEKARIVEIQWLIDTPSRLHQYLALAREQGLQFRVNVEIDVGLHRGGIQTLEALDQIMALINDAPEHLIFSGFMGYDAHLAKAPALPWKQGEARQQARSEAMAIYQRFVNHVRETWPDSYRDDLCLNGAGSMTYQLYPEGDQGCLNDFTIGSSFVKPTDFDLPTLTDHQPGLFIATPVLKKLDGLVIPFLERFAPWLAKLNVNWQKAFFVYGGWWKAKPCAPQGLRNNGIYGRSTNQEMLTASNGTGLDVDDTVFLRPTQSERVMLQFGGIRVVRGEEVIGFWSVFKE